MSKTCLLFTAIGLLGLRCIAQPITHLNFSPNPGDHFVREIGAGTTFGSGGIGLTWDCSDLEADDSEDITYLDPSTVASSILFPTATVAYYFGAGVRFYATAASGLDYLGYVNDWDTILFDDPDRIISYPLSYGDSYDDDFHATVFGIDAQVEQGHRNHVADGTGDLILPFGTVSNVLRVHSTSTTISVVGTDTTTFYDEWFTFYKPGVHFEILSSSFDGQWAGWLDEYSIGLQESLIHPIGIDVFPNPAQCQVDLVYSFTDGRMRCQVLDATGRTVFEQLLEGKAGIARASVTLTGWASGMYTVRITDEHGASGIARLVVR